MLLTRRDMLGGAAAAGGAAALPFGASMPASAAAPLAAKQNPGWYRYKVGSFEVTVVTDGRNSNPLPDNYAANAAKADVNKVLAANHYPADRAVQTYTPVVINTGSKLVAIDAGLGPALYNQSKGAVGQYQTNLAASGIDPKQIDVVLLSHLHGDHYNGLIDAENKPIFTNAEIMVPEAEYKFWMDESNASKVPEVLKGNFAGVKRVFNALGGKVTQHAPEKELVPGITAMSTPGHSPAHTSHLVTSGSEKVLVQADITAGMAFLFVQKPEWQLVFDSDKAQAVQTRKKIYDMAVAERMLVQGFHFTFPGIGYIEKAGDGYRMVPAPWNPSI